MKHLNPTPISSPQRQHGIALMMGMLVLIILAVVGINTMNESVLQERMTGGLRNAELAINGAESGLRQGERFLWDWQLSSNGVSLVSDAGGSQGVYTAEVDNPFVSGFRAQRVWGTDGRQFDSYDLTSVPYGALASNPRFIIEEIVSNTTGGPGEQGAGAAYGNSGSQGKLRFFRVTARSPGGNNKVVRLVESTFTFSE